MFRCQICDSVVPKGVRGHRLVVQTRTTSYGPRGTKPTFQPRWRGRTRSKRPLAYDKGGEGTEIVKELVVCPECAKEHADTPEE